ncbi:Beta-barrel assembly machine subunit BamE [Nitrosomonas sp. Nm84]|nr:Beta-barrel assembly machine subunit BamE [Nitrosomonas sp. Nm84]
MLPILLLALLVTQVSGCSVFMAAKQPVKKDISLFSIGVPRTVLIAEYGAPIISEYKDNKKIEIFKFVQGYSTGAKVSRAFFHGAASVVTLGLWELVGIPTEITFSGDEMAYLVKYDENDLVDEVIAIKTE